MEIITNLLELSGMTMNTLITILAIPALGFGLWRAFGGDWVKNLFSNLVAKAKQIKPGAKSTANEPAFETLLDAVDELCHDETLSHDKRFELAAEALKLAQRASDVTAPVVPAEIIPNG